MVKIFCSLFFLAILLTGCKGDEHPVPYVPVNLIINTDLPLYQSLQVPGGWAYIDGGSRGIVVYNDFDDIVAYDRHTTINVDDPCSQVFVNPSNQFELIDTCSNVKYSIINGVVTEGAAQFPLRTYNTSWEGQQNIRIFN